MDVARELEANIGRLSRSNITVYSINTRGVYQPDYLQMEDHTVANYDPTVLTDIQDSIASVATETGGTFFQNTENFGLALQSIMSDLDSYYELCYVIHGSRAKKGYHRITVECAVKRVALRYRKGYSD